MNARTKLVLALLLLAPLLSAAPAAGDVVAPPQTPAHAYALVMSGTTFDLAHGPDTPLLEAALGELVLFNVVVPATAEAHTFHLHGHPWFVPNGTVTSPTQPALGGTVVDTFLLQPGDEHSFTVLAGGADKQAGDWMYHCHFEAHLAAGMWGIFRVYPNAVSVTSAGPTLDVSVTHLGVPIDSATFTATLDDGPLPLHAQPLGNGHYAVHTSATRGVLVLTAHAPNGDSVARIGLGGAAVPQPTLRSESARLGLPLAAGTHAH